MAGLVRSGRSVLYLVGLAACSEGAVSEPQDPRIDATVEADSPRNGDSGGRGDSGDSGDSGGPAHVPNFGGWPAASKADVNDIESVATVDLDGDGLVDFAGCDQSLRVFINPGVPWVEEGELTAALTVVSLDEDCTELDALDADGDGDQDLVMLENKTASVLILANEGGGALASGAAIGASSSATAEMATGDFDGDGRVDIAVVPWVFWNEGGGGFTETPSPCDPSDSRQAAAPVVTGGRSVLLCEDNAWVATVERQWGAAAADSECDWPVAEGGPVRAADLDGDGFLDTTSHFKEVRFCRGDGTGSLVNEDVLYASDDTSAVSNFADASGDGLADFLVASDGGDSDLSVFHGAPGGPVLDAQLVMPVDPLSDIGGLYIDADDDGAANIVAWSTHTDELAWFEPGPDGRFPAPWMVELAPNEEHYTAPADLDGDGRADLVVVGFSDFAWYSAGEERQLVLGGAGSISYSTSVPDPLPAADLDGDGRQEALFHYFDTWLVFQDDGGGGVVLDYPDDAPGVSDWTHRSFVSDLDGDGDDELLLENLGTMRGDLDGDGAIDEYEQLLVGGTGEVGFPTTWTHLEAEVGACRSVLAGHDLDGDGQHDLAFLVPGGLRTWGWDGATLAEQTTSTLDWEGDTVDDPSRRWTGAQDHDGDGRIDIYLALRGEEAILVARNDGGGQWSASERLAAPATLVDSLNPLSLHAGPEAQLLAWEADSDDASVSTWRIGPTEILPLPKLTGGFESRPVPADVDADAWPDLVGSSEQRAWVYWGEPE